MASTIPPHSKVKSSQEGPGRDDSEGFGIVIHYISLISLLNTNIELPTKPNFTTAIDIVKGAQAIQVHPADKVDLVSIATPACTSTSRCEIKELLGVLVNNSPHVGYATHNDVALVTLPGYVPFFFDTLAFVDHTPVTKDINIIKSKPLIKPTLISSMMEFNYPSVSFKGLDNMKFEIENGVALLTFNGSVKAFFDTLVGTDSILEHDEDVCAIQEIPDCPECMESTRHNILSANAFHKDTDVGSIGIDRSVAKQSGSPPKPSINSVTSQPFDGTYHSATVKDSDALEDVVIPNTMLTNEIGEIKNSNANLPQPAIDLMAPLQFIDKWSQDELPDFEDYEPPELEAGYLPNFEDGKLFNSEHDRLTDSKYEELEDEVEFEIKHGKAYDPNGKCTTSASIWFMGDLSQVILVEPVPHCYDLYAGPNNRYFNRDGNEFHWDEDFEFFYDANYSVLIVEDGHLIPTGQLHPHSPQDHHAGAQHSQSDNNTNGTNTQLEQSNEPSASAFTWHGFKTGVGAENSSQMVPPSSSDVAGQHSCSPGFDIPRQSREENTRLLDAITSTQAVPYTSQLVTGYLGENLAVEQDLDGDTCMDVQYHPKVRIHFGASKSEEGSKNEAVEDSNYTDPRLLSELKRIRTNLREQPFHKQVPKSTSAKVQSTQPNSLNVKFSQAGGANDFPAFSPCKLVSRDHQSMETTEESSQTNTSFQFGASTSSDHTKPAFHSTTSKPLDYSTTKKYVKVPTSNRLSGGGEGPVKGARRKAPKPSAASFFDVGSTTAISPMEPAAKTLAAPSPFSTGNFSPPNAPSFDFSTATTTKVHTAAQFKQGELVTSSSIYEKHPGPSPAPTHLGGFRLKVTNHEEFRIVVNSKRGARSSSEFEYEMNTNWSSDHGTLEEFTAEDNLDSFIETDHQFGVVTSCDEQTARDYWSTLTSSKETVHKDLTREFHVGGAAPITFESFMNSWWPQDIKDRWEMSSWAVESVLLEERLVANQIRQLNNEPSHIEAQICGEAIRWHQGQINTGVCTTNQRRRTALDQAPALNEKSILKGTVKEKYPEAQELPSQNTPSLRSPNLVDSSLLHPRASQMPEPPQAYIEGEVHCVDNEAVSQSSQTASPINITTPDAPTLERCLADGTASTDDGKESDIPIVETKVPDTTCTTENETSRDSFRASGEPVARVVEPPLPYQPPIEHLSILEASEQYLLRGLEKAGITIAAAIADAKLSLKQNRYWPVVHSVFKEIMNKLCPEEQLTVSSSSNSAQGTSTTSVNSAGSNGAQVNMGGRNKNQDSDSKNDGESCGQGDQNDRELGKSYGFSSSDDDHEDGDDYEDDRDTEMSCSSSSGSDAPTVPGPTAPGIEDDKETESKDINVEDIAPEEPLYVDPNAPCIFYNRSTSGWSRSGQRIAWVNEQILTRANEDTYRQDPSLFVRESRVGTPPRTSSRLDHNGQPTDLPPEDWRPFDWELEPRKPT
ncbi:hypothetical protein AOQ84DRAFT_380286 [Glonium stellatum]|uniref:Uncharacterized protein n=1 Tax=Glonium stellatum TaxID=574774 RepID=A0A8E2JPI1_9PEZI|nr:hypothetical protein AOQ84DRAFT_380286 [Glonium stellatum]